MTTFLLQSNTDSNENCNNHNHDHIPTTRMAEHQVDMMLTPEDFDAIATRAIDRIPEELREYLENVVISVQQQPSAELLEEMGMDPEEDTLLG